MQSKIIKQFYMKKIAFFRINTEDNVASYKAKNIVKSFRFNDESALVFSTRESTLRRSFSDYMTHFMRKAMEQ